MLATLHKRSTNGFGEMRILANGYPDSALDSARQVTKLSCTSNCKTKMLHDCCFNLSLLE
jgi:hypothetical protein